MRRRYRCRCYINSMVKIKFVWHESSYHVLEFIIVFEEVKDHMTFESSPVKFLEHSRIQQKLFLVKKFESDLFGYRLNIIRSKHL